MRRLIFTILSLVAIAISPRSLFHPRSHGFYRFFAFEFLIALILRNATRWFRRPFSSLQLISWASLLSSAVLAIHGFRLLNRIGRPQNGIENTQELVQAGAYAYIRHPVYTSLLLLGLGAFLKDVSLTGLGLLLGSAGCLAITAQVEERENLAKFGSKYDGYREQTWRFIPFVY